MVIRFRYLAVLCFLFAGCASSDPGTTVRSESDARTDGALPIDGGTGLEAGLECACSGAASEMRDVTGRCGVYQESRTCDGCEWSAWAGQSPACTCTPGQVGETRQAEGGEGCDKGVRTEREVCNEAGTRYEWEPQGDYDGSLKGCEPGLTESRGANGACGSYSQTRECSQTCEPGEWSADTSCNCTYGDGMNTRACATDNGDDCGVQTCQAEGKWGACEDNPDAPESCEPCTPVCKSAASTSSEPTVCEGKRGTGPCPNGSGYASCTCRANGSWGSCGTVCFQ